MYEIDDSTYYSATITDTAHIILAFGWCHRTFGDSSIYGRWCRNNNTYYFRDESDYNWFILRWS